MPVRPIGRLRQMIFGRMRLERSAPSGRVVPVEPVRPVSQVRKEKGGKPGFWSWILGLFGRKKPLEKKPPEPGHIDIQA